MKFNILKEIESTYPVARSQSKRLCAKFEDAKEIELDFAGIPEVGPSFTHEIFAVFQNAHPEVNITAVNVTEDVKRMIYRAKHA